MKQGIHPNWQHDCVVTCSCGNTFNTGSGSKSLQIDICNMCHPYFTGEMKFVDRQGRVEKFLKKMKVAQKKKITTTKTQKKAKKVQEDQKSYQQILREQRSKLTSQKKSTEKSK